jgi:hypothetical protein
MACAHRYLIDQCKTTWLVMGWIVGPATILDLASILKGGVDFYNFLACEQD